MLFGIGSVLLICLALYFSDPGRRREERAAEPMGQPLDAVAQPEPNEIVAKAEPNEVAIQAEPNQVTSQTEPNEVEVRTASDVDNFKDEPEARALYEKMVEAMRNAKSLSYRGSCSATGRGPAYEVWMKKPNYFRVETVNL